MPLEGLAELEVGIEDGVGFVPPELLQPGRVDPTIHAGRHGAPLETVTPEDGGVEAGGLDAGLDDPSNRSGIDGVGADHRGGEGGVRRAGPCRRQPRSAESVDRPSRRRWDP